jgi:hypothetical protein
MTPGEGSARLKEEGKMTDDDLTPGTQRAPFAPTAVAPPEWWADARIPRDDAGTPAS